MARFASAPAMGAGNTDGQCRVGGGARAARDSRWARMAAITRGSVMSLLKWVPAADERQLKAAFDQAVRVRQLGGDARELAEQ